LLDSTNYGLRVVVLCADENNGVGVVQRFAQALTAYWDDGKDEKYIKK